MNILVVRLGSLGDLVRTLPAVNALRRSVAAARIDWLVDAAHREFLSLVPVLTSVVVLRGRGPGGWLHARRQLRATRYDIAIDFQGLIKSAALARFSGAKRVAGFDRRALREPLAAAFYTEQVEVGEGSHVIEKNMRLAGALGADASQAPAFPISEVESPVVSAFIAADSRPFALLNPGAAWPNKRWPPERLGQIARALRARHDLDSVVLWGPREDGIARAAVEASGGVARLAPETGLRDLISLARHARLMVSGDTGPLHIAAALGVPVVAIFGPTSPVRNGPWHRDDITISKYDSCACHYRRRCRNADSDWCLGQVSADDVVNAIDARLGLAVHAAPDRR